MSALKIRDHVLILSSRPIGLFKGREIREIKNVRFSCIARIAAGVFERLKVTLNMVCGLPQIRCPKQPGRTEYPSSRIYANQGGFEPFE